MKKIEYYKHNLNSKDKMEVVKVLNSPYLTTGAVVSKFEKNFSKFLNAKFCVGVTSCTDALFLSLKGLGVSPGDKVITTSMTFISTSNAIEYCGAKPIFVDIESQTGNINADLIETKIDKKTKAILVTHLYGQMCDMKKISKIAKKYNLKVIEDCAHCIEGERDRIKPGQLSDAACFSFYATKNITSGEGGAIVTNNKKLYNELLKTRNNGMLRKISDNYRNNLWNVDSLGYKANMSNIQAALLINQIPRINKLHLRKTKIAAKYDAGFSKNPNLKIIGQLPNSKHARHIYAIKIINNNRNQILNGLQKSGIMCSVHFMPIHTTMYYSKKYNIKKGLLPVTEDFGKTILSIPFYPKLKNDEAKYIIKTINKITS